MRTPDHLQHGYRSGGKNASIEPDEITEKYVSRRAQRKYKFYKSDKKANYHRCARVRPHGMERRFALPALPRT